MFTFTTLVPDLDPSAYLAALVRMAFTDGLDPGEKAFIRQQAMVLGVNPARVPTQEPDWSDHSRVTRKLVYRDCYSLCLTDGQVTERERAALGALRARLGLEEGDAEVLEQWVERHARLLAEGERLLIG